MYKSWAVFIGALVTIMITFNGILSSHIGDYASLVLIHLIGLITVTVLLVIKRRKVSLKKEIPFYLFSAGAIGVVLIFCNNLCFKALGASLTLAIGLFGQTMLSVLIDSFGLFGMEKHSFQKRKIIGFSLILVGIAIMVIY